MDVMVKSGRGENDEVSVIPSNEVIKFQVEGDNIAVYTIKDKYFLVVHLQDIARILNDQGFHKSDRSVLFNIEYATGFDEERVLVILESTKSIIKNTATVTGKALKAIKEIVLNHLCIKK
jgi:DNA-binding LytR/AlgR family response regulator